MAPKSCLLPLLFAGFAFAQTSSPLDIAFVLDVSRNMDRTMNFVAAGARLATFELGSDDRVAVISYSSGAKLQTGFTSDGTKIQEAFNAAIHPAIRRSGKLCLYDAVSLALEQFPAAPDAARRRVIAVITNDVDQGSRRTPADIIREAGARGVAVWGFFIASPAPDIARSKVAHREIPYPDAGFAARQLQPTLNKTGGKAVVVDTNGYILRRAIAVCKGEEQ
jgi:hypothetical protein